MTIRPKTLLRIAQVSPLYESVPPKLYGGTERVVSYLTEELVELGHDVTLFASGDSTTKARLVACCPKALRLNPDCIDQLAHHYVMLEEIFARAEEFDIIHFHIDYLHFPISRVSGIPQLTTLHGRLDLSDLTAAVSQVSGHAGGFHFASATQAAVLSQTGLATFITVCPRASLGWEMAAENTWPFSDASHRRNALDRAIEIAMKVGMPLKIAAKIDRVDREYFESRIKPMLDNPNIEYIGEITEDQKSEFLGNAYAYLFPIDWPEPFGLTMIESMACGTPTIAFNCGSVPGADHPRHKRFHRGKHGGCRKGGSLAWRA